MKVAVMQPYFFPYIGYFQLMNSIDEFVVFDDVQYIDRGWVNRNRIRVNHSAKWLTMPVQKASRKSLINQRHYLAEPETIGQIKARLEAYYSKTKHFPKIFPLIEDCLEYPDSNVARFNTNLLAKVSGALNIKCKIHFSSNIVGDPSLGGQSRIIEICKSLGGGSYLNLEGGQSLYNAEAFWNNGIRLCFVKCKVHPLSLSEGSFHLSIIDTLMTKGILGTKRELAEYLTVDA